jgi:hypothetical protein
VRVFESRMLWKILGRETYSANKELHVLLTSTYRILLGDCKEG